MSDPPVLQTDLKPGDRVRIMRAIVGRKALWTTAVEGVVESVGTEPTGSWFAHGKGMKLWLQRVRLRKADGEVTDLVDGHTDRDRAPARSGVNAAFRQVFITGTSTRGVCVRIERQEAR